MFDFMAHILHTYYLFGTTFWIRNVTLNFNMVPMGKYSLLYDSHLMTISRSELLSTYNLHNQVYG